MVLEIGGNDILLSPDPDSFADRLDELLADVTERADVVVMFELPLPPFFHAYGAAQRRLAQQYGVLLIPKRVLMGVLANGDSTLDSIHLSQEGHRLMASKVGRILQRVEK